MSTSRGATISLFDSPDERLARQLHRRARAPAQAVRALAHELGVSLNYRHTREVEYVLFAAWLQNQVAIHGGRVLGDGTTPRQYASVVDQASRIGAHFTREQAAIYDEAVRAAKASPSTFDVDLGEEPRTPDL